MSFAKPYDLYCLVAESSLVLLDRALAAGDVVKRSLSDAQSGTVISTSLTCGLRPVCNASEYTEKAPRTTHGICSYSREPGESQNHCLPRCIEAGIPGHHPFLNEEIRDVPASELQYWKKYREDDIIIYEDWVGRILYVVDEVTVRLINGSVVVVEDPDELQEPFWISGSHSSELHKHLCHSGFISKWPKNDLRQDGKAKDCEAQPCYPGQIVQAKKGNLRRGRWKFGAYDPNITPQGIVVDVRTVQLEVRWSLPNIFKPNRAQTDPPPIVLDVSIPDLEEVTIYDRNKLPRKAGDSQSINASFAPDVDFGHHVRFRDLDGELATRPNRIPRKATQGFDMNVYEVTQTRTSVTVQWQDSTTTEEDSISLLPYNNVDEQDLWPGDYVSLQAEEEVNKDADIVTCHKMGVVQSVEATERLARVRWFVDTIASVSIEDSSIELMPTHFGPISDEYSDVSLYDIICYSAFGFARGDMLVVVPDPLPPPHTVLVDQLPGVKAILHRLFQENTQRGLDYNPRPDMATELIQDDFDWIGDVIDVGLDGNATVRLGATSEVHDIHLPFWRCVLLEDLDPGEDTSESSDEEGFDDVSYQSEREFLSDSEINSTESRARIEMEMEIAYEGGVRMDDESNDEMWSTEEEEQKYEPISSSPNTRTDDSHDHPINKVSDETWVTEDEEQNPNQTSKSLDPPVDNNNHTASTAAISRELAPGLRLLRYPSMPAQFTVLEDSPPADHHFINHPSKIIAPILGRIIKEHRIMNSSLPEGVFVRTWESRLDLLRVLIVGPRDTPYELAPFMFDFYFTHEFPGKPPEAYFHSWTDGRGRINPNLYEDGKICLSLLGTWPGDDVKERWNAKGSSMLQVIVSLLGLVLVQEPYFSKSLSHLLSSRKMRSANMMT